jgi:serine/threonine protein kinase
MATATLPLLWKGLAGRAYVPVRGAKVRHGSVGVVRKVHPVGAPTRPGDPTADQPLALKLWTEGGEASLDQLQSEIRTLEWVSRLPGDALCPRVVDHIGDPAVVGVVVEWCPGNLEDWWVRSLRDADAIGRLLAVLAEVTRQIAAYHAAARGRGGLAVCHGDLKPANILLSGTGRWLLSDFGAPPLGAPVESPYVESDVVPDGGVFLAPELRFHAKIPRPTSIDVWGVGAVLFALLRLRRVVLDGGPVPRNGSMSPRFLSRRAEQVVEVFRASPARFVDKALEPSAFPTPDVLPEPDRLAIREALRGAFGDDDDALEKPLCDAVLPILERTLSVDPERRFGDADTLAGALEAAARQWIGLAAKKEEQDGRPAGEPGPAVEAVLRERDIARARAAALSAEVTSLQERVDTLTAQFADAQQRATTAEHAAPVVVRAAEPDPAVAATMAAESKLPAVLAALGLVLTVQVATLLAVAVVIALVALA